MSTSVNAIDTVADSLAPLFVVLSAKQASVLRFSTKTAGPKLVATIDAALRLFPWSRCLRDFSAALCTFHYPVKLIVMPVAQSLCQMWFSANEAKPRREMVLAVRRTILEHLQITHSVILFVSVFVMNHLIPAQGPSEVACHDKTMLQDVPAGHGIRVIWSPYLDVTGVVKHSLGGFWHGLGGGL